MNNVATGLKAMPSVEYGGLHALIALCGLAIIALSVSPPVSLAIVARLQGALLWVFGDPRTSTARYNRIAVLGGIAMTIPIVTCSSAPISPKTTIDVRISTKSGVNMVSTSNGRNQWAAPTWLAAAQPDCHFNNQACQKNRDSLQRESVLLVEHGLILLHPSAMAGFRFNLRGLMLATAVVAAFICALDMVPPIIWVLLVSFAVYLVLTALAAYSVAMLCLAVARCGRWLLRSRRT